MIYYLKRYFRELWLDIKWSTRVLFGLGSALLQLFIIAYIAMYAIKFFKNL